MAFAGVRRVALGVVCLFFSGSDVAVTYCPNRDLQDFLLQA